MIFYHFLNLSSWPFRSHLITFYPLIKILQFLYSLSSSIFYSSPANLTSSELFSSCFFAQRRIVLSIGLFRCALKCLFTLKRFIHFWYYSRNDIPRHGIELGSRTRVSNPTGYLGRGLGLASFCIYYCFVTQTPTLYTADIRSGAGQRSFLTLALRSLFHFSWYSTATNQTVPLQIETHCDRNRRPDKDFSAQQQIETEIP